MTPTVSRLLRWAAVIALAVALTLAAWQDPVLAHGTSRSAGGVPGFAVALLAPVALGLLLAVRRRPPRLSRRPAAVPPLSVPRSPGTCRSRS
ncbi:hypothetical protein [Micromonospora sp. WMMD998]|uniref:hypothetical protein n=1 Tax=Micromonospora sp. WMMD998 TaxID=3016092 RepID=UPI00249CD50A|nr:hypothetical protein [Micromonospora sp. WMMD998]WFE39611.1 hypothetical protein O7619_14695 [Micromonospora sp. WMMD998]